MWSQLLVHTTSGAEPSDDILQCIGKGLKLPVTVVLAKLRPIQIHQEQAYADHPIPPRKHHVSRLRGHQRFPSRQGLL